MAMRVRWVTAVWTGSVVQTSVEPEATPGRSQTPGLLDTGCDGAWKRGPQRCLRL
jgi:hypothetical protein